MKRIKKYLKVILITLMISTPVALWAQPDDPGGDDVLDNPVPFDGGVSLLVAAGIAYGLKKAHAQRKGKNGMIAMDDKVVD